MSGATLFGDLPEGEAEAGGAKREWAGQPRLREPVRDQIEFRLVDLDALLAADHRARVIWAYVEKLDLCALEAAVKARAHGPGQSAASPRLYMALWLYATSEGVGSARALARLTECHDAYRWLCGGVGVNYHGLADFRSAHPQLLERLLIENVAALSAAGVIDLDEVVQDGARVRACAGSSSFRRRKALHKELDKAKRLVQRLAEEGKSDPDASNARIRAAAARAAREREARVEAALGELAAIEAHRARPGRANRNNKKKGTKKAEPRVSASDPEARVMKMPDGGFRPAYNCQISSVAKGQIAIAVSAETVGSDRGLMQPMLAALKASYERLPKRHLVDGGFNNKAAIEWAAEHDVKVYGAPPNSKHKTDPYLPRKEDGPGVAAWRRRMKSPHGRHVYKRRAPGECINARLRTCVRQLTVRGKEKVNTVLTWFALANNILAGHRLLAAA